MPFTHTSTFHTRYYQCDAYGHLNNTYYVRFMQEAAFAASAAAGYSLERYTELGRYWLAYITEVEYLRPVRYGDDVQVKTWVEYFRRSSSRRRYELRVAGSDELVARGHTDWVYVDAASGRPTSITPDMAAAFFPEGAPERHAERDPFPAAPPPPAGVYNTHLRVRWQDIDSAGMVNNPVYLEYIEAAGFRAVAHFGWPFQRMQQAGFGVLLRKTHIRYVQPARLDDELEISTWASQVRRSTAVRHYAIRRAQDGELLAEANCLGVWVDLASGRPIRIPPEFMESFAPNLVTAD